MKKLMFIAVAALMCAFSASAQNVMVVNTETIFTSMASYKDAMDTLDKMGQQYQTTIDNAYAEVEKMFNDYQEQRAYLSEASRRAREEAIITREKEINQYADQVFGQEGDLMARRIELVKPIQDRVFGTINSYAQSNGFDVVLDTAGNPTILYFKPTADRTQEIIRLLN